MSLRNRVALVTGGSRGIGRGLALRLAQDGARIAIAYRSNKVAAQQTLRQLQAGGADCVAVETDITDSNGCDRLIKTDCYSLDPHRIHHPISSPALRAESTHAEETAAP